MDGSWGGADEEALVRALRRAGTADPGVDATALAAGARGRARTLRRRRRGVAGLVAVLAVAAPVGVSQWPSRPTSFVQPAVPPSAPAPAPSPVSIPDDALLDTADVTAVLPGAAPIDPPPLGEGTDLRAGLCRDDAYTGTDPALAARGVAWSTPVGDGPLPRTVGEDVFVFAGDGARQWFGQTAAQAEECTTTAQERGTWTLVPDAGFEGDDALVAYAQELAGDAPQWNAVVVVRSGGLLVRVTVQSAHPSAQDTVAEATQLARRALARAGDLRTAGATP